jgi:thiol-disulfide isomerase/thioredoxin
MFVANPLRRPVLGLILLAFVAGCQVAQPADQEPLTVGEETSMSAAPTVKYPLQGMAPELVGDTWLNAEAPLRLADLQGRVVLLEMWTFGCINCRNTLPAVRDWHARYADQGLVIIGNHYPEFDYEADLGNLKQAVADLDITYPVVQDNAGENFLAYRSRYWPTLYLIDKQGRLRYTHIGEGAYDETEQAIATLLSEGTR